MDRKKIQKQLKIFIERVNKKFNPERIILFGSYARGKANDYSDIDILVVASKFKRLSEDDRFSQLYKLCDDLYPDINAFGFTPEEVKKSKQSFNPIRSAKNRYSLAKIKIFGIIEKLTL